MCAHAREVALYVSAASTRRPVHASNCKLLTARSADSQITPCTASCAGVVHAAPAPSKRVSSKLASRLDSVYESYKTANAYLARGAALERAPLPRRLRRSGVPTSRYIVADDSRGRVPSASRRGNPLAMLDHWPRPPRLTWPGWPRPSCLVHKTISF